MTHTERCSASSIQSAHTRPKKKRCGVTRTPTPLLLVEVGWISWIVTPQIRIAISKLMGSDARARAVVVRVRRVVGSSPSERLRTHLCTTWALPRRLQTKQMLCKLRTSERSASFVCDRRAHTPSVSRGLYVARLSRSVRAAAASRPAFLLVWRCRPPHAGGPLGSGRSRPRAAATCRHARTYGEREEAAHSAS